MSWDFIAGAIDVVLRETLLFAALGILLGGLDDLIVDLFYLVLSARRAIRRKSNSISDFPSATQPLRLVVFVAAWDESAVIGTMLRTALGRFDHPDHALYVGAYPNDPATIQAVAAVAETDKRIRLVIGDRPGPTTKGDCLNNLWQALRRDEQDGARRADAIILHDAEDVVHQSELRVFDHLIRDYATVQLPVLPLVHRGSRMISGHYCDEFAESHSKQMIVRDALGVGLPLAGVGCAIARDTLDRLAAAREGAPFDRSSLTEDYEMGLAVADQGGRSVFAPMVDLDGSRIAVRAYFPASLDAAVRQKARWMIGIALAGWDRIGWSRWRDWREHWMRMRDRRAPLAMLVLGAAYLSLVAWAISRTCHWLAGAEPPAASYWVRLLLIGNAAVMVWRLGARYIFTSRIYGWREGLLSVPRSIIANLIAMLAARRALVLYVIMLFDGVPRWDKTDHIFPEAEPGVPL
ncbi:MAG: glycosyl transferase family protein [Sphingomonas sp.]